MKRDYGKYGNNGTNGNFPEFFRLFRYFRIFRNLSSFLNICAAFVVCSLSAFSQPAPQNEEFRALQAHFDREISDRFNRLFEGIENVRQWEERKHRTRQALEKMLWHNRRFPSGTPPAKLAGREERPTYTVESLILETAPGLYLTANMYLPRSGPKPFPVILYQCGHANENYYSRHGAWFAAHGIATLVMDNIEQGEIQTTHHGVYSNAWFHWYSRGYSPLAVELLNARRAIDYLVSRPDLDSKRIGATGRSGGGMTTFYLAALDERVVASAPVSGILSTAGWVRHRLTFAHCDCQYPVNSHGLMYSEIGALIAPRKQLLVNADADRGFPMDAFTEMADKMREIYRLYSPGGELRTAVTRGGHEDIEEIRLPVFSFFLKEFLGVEAPVTAEGPIDIPPPESLVCFRDGAPIDERLTRIDEELIPAYTPIVRAMARDPRERIETIVSALRSDVFRYFPEQPSPLAPVWGEEKKLNGRISKKVSFNSFEDLRVRGVFSRPITATSGTRLP